MVEVFRPSNLLARARALRARTPAELAVVLIELLEALLSAGDTTEAASVLERLRVVAGPSCQSASTIRTPS
jgi:hypothetical protein